MPYNKQKSISAYNVRKMNDFLCIVPPPEAPAGLYLQVKHKN